MELEGTQISGQGDKLNMTSHDFGRIVEEIEYGADGQTINSFDEYDEITNENIRRLLAGKDHGFLDDLLTFVGHPDDHFILKILAVYSLDNLMSVFGRLWPLANLPGKRLFFLRSVSACADAYSEAGKPIPIAVKELVIESIRPLAKVIEALPIEEARWIVIVLGDFPSPESLDLLHYLDMSIPENEKANINELNFNMVFDHLGWAINCCREFLTAQQLQAGTNKAGA